MDYWAIIHIPTGDYMPHLLRGGGGHTASMPSKTRPPRLFRTRHHANMALRFWLQGRWRSDQDGYPHLSKRPHLDTVPRIPADFVVAHLGIRNLDIEGP